MRALGSALSTAVLGLALTASPAGAVTFGADLAAHPANDNALSTCAQSPPGYFLPQGSASCMWSFQGIGAGAPTLVAPATGTVSRVRVKVGATTGPMRQAAPTPGPQAVANRAGPGGGRHPHGASARLQNHANRTECSWSYLSSAIFLCNNSTSPAHTV